MNEWMDDNLNHRLFQICFMLNFVQERRIIPNVCLGALGGWVLLFYEEPLVSFSSATKKIKKNKNWNLSWFQFHT
jgi:hypothetical protein